MMMAVFCEVVYLISDFMSDRLIRGRIGQEVTADRFSKGNGYCFSPLPVHFINQKEHFYVGFYTKAFSDTGKIIKAV